MIAASRAGGLGRPLEPRARDWQATSLLRASAAEQIDGSTDSDPANVPIPDRRLHQLRQHRPTSEPTS
jgi:hypothetical protein